MTSYKPDHDLGWDGPVKRCISCSALLNGPEYVLYSVGDPGVEESRAECPECGARYRWFQENEYGVPFDWVSRNRGWAVSDFRGRPDGFKAAVTVFSVDGSVPCYLENDGTVTYGDFGGSERYLPKSVKTEVDRRLSQYRQANSLSIRKPRTGKNTSTTGPGKSGAPSGQHERTHRRVSERRNARGSR